MSEWKPIESAPKDGTDVLVWCGKFARIGYATPDHKGNAFWQCDGQYERPTHWQPLPPPPVKGGL